MESVCSILTSKEILSTFPELFENLEQFRVVYLEDFEGDTKLLGCQDIEAILIVYKRAMLGPMKDEEFISSMPKLKIISTPSIGVDHLDLRMLQRHGVKVSNVPSDVIADPTAEFGFGLMLALARNIYIGLQAYQGDNFNWFTFLMTQSGSLLLGSTLGIVGMGRIGYKVAERAAAFKMKILYHNRKQRSKEEESQVQATYCRSLDELLSKADHVMLTVPLTEETKGMMGAREFKLMKPTASIINISRGDVVDQDALIEALQQKTIRGAALDVTSPEPLPRDHTLRKMSNVILTPHCAGATERTARICFQVCMDNIKAAVEGRTIPNDVKLLE